MPTMPPPDSFIKVDVMRAELTAPPEDLLSLPSVLSGSANTRVAISTGNGAATTQNKAAGGEAIKWAETFALPFFSGKDSTVRFAVEKCSGGVAGELLGEATLRGADFAKGVMWIELRKPSSRDVRLGGKSPQSDSKLLRFRAGATGAAASAGTRAGRIEVRVQLLELGALSMAQAKTLIGASRAASNLGAGDAPYLGAPPPLHRRLWQVRPAQHGRADAAQAGAGDAAALRQQRRRALVSGGARVVGRLRC